mgnify:CR=1 FL=1
MFSHRQKTQTLLNPPDYIPLPSSPIGIYIHVPFCRKACYYCDFYFSVRKSWMESYTQALLEEIKAWEPWLKAQAVRTVYFGGGTPSWLSFRLLQKIMDALQRCTIWQPVEITLEANPEDITRENLLFWRDLGINRLSLGVQSLSDEILQLLGRKATADITRRAIELIGGVGWENWSVDVIFAVPGQTISLMAQELRYLAEKIQVPHISLYGLTIEPRTVLYKKQLRGRFEAISDEAYAEMYLFIHDFLGRYGYEHYEVSNWSRAGFHSRHNLAYWEGKPYVGLGPSAHSYISPYRWWNKPDLREYMKQAVNIEVEKIDRREMVLEWFMLRFRLSREIRWEDIPISQESLQNLKFCASSWVERGWVKLSSQGISILPYGWLWLDTILKEVLELVVHAA